jgi:hypothetical protein
LLNCPTHRRTWEKRSKRRFGMKEWGNSRMVPFNHRIRTDHEVRKLRIMAPLDSPDR